VVLNAGTTSYLDTAVVAGTTYSYRVIAANAAGYSPASNTGTVLVPVAVPLAPTALVGSAVSRSQINLSWRDNSTNETGFRIECSTNGSTWTQIGTVGSNVQTYSSTGLRTATTYYFRVQAFNNAGASAYTTKVTVKTLR
jgi:titin